MYLFSLRIRERCIRACILEATWRPQGSPGIMGLQVNTQLSSNQCSHLLNSVDLNCDAILSLSIRVLPPGIHSGFSASLCKHLAASHTAGATAICDPRRVREWDFHWSAEQRMRWMFELSLGMHLCSVFVAFVSICTGCLQVEDVFTLPKAPPPRPHLSPPSNWTSNQSASLLNIRAPRAHLLPIIHQWVVLTGWASLQGRTWTWTERRVRQIWSTWRSVTAGRDSKHASLCTQPTFY